LFAAATKLACAASADAELCGGVEDAGPPEAVAGADSAAALVVGVLLPDACGLGLEPEPHAASVIVSAAPITTAPANFFRLNINRPLDRARPGIIVTERVRGRRLDEDKVI